MDVRRDEVLTLFNRTARSGFPEVSDSSSVTGRIERNLKKVNSVPLLFTRIWRKVIGASRSVCESAVVTKSGSTEPGLPGHKKIEESLAMPVPRAIDVAPNTQQWNCVNPVHVGAHVQHELTGILRRLLAK